MIASRLIDEIDVRHGGRKRAASSGGLVAVVLGKRAWRDRWSTEIDSLGG